MAVVCQVITCVRPHGIFRYSKSPGKKFGQSTRIIEVGVDAVRCWPRQSRTQQTHASARPVTLSTHLTPCAYRKSYGEEYKVAVVWSRGGGAGSERVVPKDSAHLVGGPLSRPQQETGQDEGAPRGEDGYAIPKAGCALCTRPRPSRPPPHSRSSLSSSATHSQGWQGSASVLVGWGLRFSSKLTSLIDRSITSRKLAKF